MTVTEMKQKRAGIVAAARKINDVAVDEKRSLNAGEQEAWDKHMTDVDGIAKQIADAESTETRSKLLEGYEQEMNRSSGRKTNPEAPGAGAAGAEQPSDSFKMEVRSQPGSGREYDLIEFPKSSAQYRLSTPERRALHSRWLAGGRDVLGLDEYRDLQSDSDVSGGFLNAPMQMIQFLLKFVDNAVVIRKKATVYQFPTATSVGVPTLDTDIDDANWTAEIATGSADAGMAFGRRELHPHPLAKRIKISNKLLRTAVLGPEAIVRDRLGYKFGVSQEKAFMTGTGSNQPLGLFTASAGGISTARDVSTGNTTSAIVADNLFEVKYSVKPQYQAKGEWLFHRTVLKSIRQLKDGQGQYLWAAGLVAGQPDMLLDRPVNQSEYVPNTMTTGLYCGMFGDLSFYWIADALNLEIQRLVELYAESNQTGFIGRLETDGMPVLEEAFARVKLG